MTSEIVREPDGHPVYRRHTAKTWTGMGEGTDAGYPIVRYATGGK